MASRESFISHALYIINTFHPTYLMGAGHFAPNGASQYDCSGFVLSVIQHELGSTGGCTYTGDMGGLVSLGFQHLAYSGYGNCKKGDVLVWNKPGTTGSNADGHTEFVYDPNAPLTIGARGGTGNPAGIGLSSVTDWQDVYRYKGGLIPKTWSEGVIYDGVSGLGWNEGIIYDGIA